MSNEINLYHPRFQKQRDLLTFGNVALAAALLYVLLAMAGGWAWQQAAARKEAAAVAEAELKSVKAKVDAAIKAAALRKPSPLLLAEAEGAEGLLRRRGEIVRLLESGAVGNTGGFADYLRGFARQAPAGLWLTGFTIDKGGSEMEIRGSMTNQAALPDYIRRLGTEKAFQGRDFAALTMTRADPAPIAVVLPAAGKGVAVAPAPIFATRPIDFVLTPKPGEAREGRP